MVHAQKRHWLALSIADWGLAGGPVKDGRIYVRLSLKRQTAFVQGVEFAREGSRSCKPDAKTEQKAVNSLEE